MNCAIHNDVPAAAFCRTCGKALCQSCRRDVRGVIYCEDCIAARVQDTIPAAATVPGGPPAVPPVVVAGSPSPGLAGVLAGFFPFGIGPVYNRQYMKGLVYMLIFAFLIWGTSTGSGLEPLLGLAIAFFYVYQIIDSVRSARAIQLGQPAPDPLGIESLAGSGENRWRSTGAPVGAIILIGLGCLFLIHNLGFWHLHIGNWWPVVLIALGVWMFTKRAETGCQCVRCRCSGLVWPTLVFTLGVLFLLHTLGVRDFDQTWPLLLIVVGLVKVLQTSGPTTGHIETTEADAPPNVPDNTAGSPNQEVSNV